MREVTSHNFGYLIAYLLPGFFALWGLSHVSPTLQAWLGASPMESPSVGGFLYVTIGSVAAGLTASTVRWLFLDGLHHVTGLRQPHWDFSQLAEKVQGFEVLVEIHYRYYQFYGNSLVALAVSYLLRKWPALWTFEPVGWSDVSGR